MIWLILILVGGLAYWIISAPKRAQAQAREYKSLVAQQEASRARTERARQETEELNRQRANRNLTGSPSSSARTVTSTPETIVKLAVGIAKEKGTEQSTRDADFPNLRTYVYDSSAYAVYYYCKDGRTGEPVIVQIWDNSGDIACKASWEVDRGVWEVEEPTGGAWIQALISEGEKLGIRA